jgi:hypothetical protein
MRLWSQNLPLDRSASPTPCGNYELDPRQYIVTVSEVLPFFSSNDNKELSSQLEKELSVLGYEIRETPVACSLSSTPVSGEP